MRTAAAFMHDDVAAGAGLAGEDGAEDGGVVGGRRRRRGRRAGERSAGRPKASGRRTSGLDLVFAQ